jgi:hypothetical protein
MMSAPAPTHSGCLDGVAISAAEVITKTLANIRQCHAPLHAER